MQVHPNLENILAGENIGSVSKELAVGERKTDELDLTFLNHKAAFKNKTTWEVFRAYAVFNLCSIRYLVDNNEMVRLSSPDTFYFWKFVQISPQLILE